MNSITDEETKTIWYYSESGFPTYLAIAEYRRQNPSYTHSIANKKTWERLNRDQKKFGLGNKKNIVFNNE